MTTIIFILSLGVVGQSANGTQGQPPRDYEDLSFVWTSIAYDAPDASWERLREAGERLSASGKGASFRANAEHRFLKKRPTTREAFKYAVVALNDALMNPLGYELSKTLAPARFYLNRAPLVRAPETARIQIMLNSLLENRPEVVVRYSSIVRLFARRYPNDLNLRYRGAMLLVSSGSKSDQSWSIAEAKQLIDRWPQAPSSHHAMMHSTFARWTRSQTRADRSAAISAARGYEAALIATHQDPSRPRRVLKVLLKQHG